MHFIISIKRKDSEEIRLLPCPPFNWVLKDFEVSQIFLLHIFLQIANDWCIYSMCMNTCLNTDQWVEESKTTLSVIASSDQTEPYKLFLEDHLFSWHSWQYNPSWLIALFTSGEVSNSFRNLHQRQQSIFIPVR